MVFGKVEESIFKIDTLINFNEGMDMLPAVRMIFLCYDVLDDGVLLTQVLQYHLRSEVTSRVGEEPTFSFRNVRHTFCILSVARLHHFAISNINDRKMV